MRYIGNFVLNPSNCKIDGDYIYVDQSNQIRNLVYTCRNKGKKLWVKFHQIAVDTVSPPFKIKYSVKIQGETNKDPTKEFSEEIEFNYDYRERELQEIVDFLQNKIKTEMQPKLDEKDEKIGKFEFKIHQRVVQVQIYGWAETQKAEVEFDENLTRLLGFTQNKLTREGNLITDRISFLPYGKPFNAIAPPKLTLDFTNNMPVLYYYHPDFISSNFNIEYVSAVYIKGQETIDYDLMYDVNSLSPNPRTYFYYYEDNQKHYYTPQSFVIVLGFYESD